MKSAIAINNKAIVSSKGQVVIPKMLREKLGIHAGNELLFKARSDGILEIKPVGRSIEMFFGRCKRDNETPMSIKEMDEFISHAVSEKNFKK
jgi:AbrB family looped-hinge helix DNA binding protein